MNTTTKTVITFSVVATAALFSGQVSAGEVKSLADIADNLTGIIKATHDPIADFINLAGVIIGGLAGTKVARLKGLVGGDTGYERGNPWYQVTIYGLASAALLKVSSILKAGGKPSVNDFEFGPFQQIVDQLMRIVS